MGGLPPPQGEQLRLPGHLAVGLRREFGEGAEQRSPAQGFIYPAHGHGRRVLVRRRARRWLFRGRAFRRRVPPDGVVRSVAGRYSISRRSRRRFPRERDTYPASPSRSWAASSTARARWPTPTSGMWEARRAWSICTSARPWSGAASRTRTRATLWWSSSRRTTAGSSLRRSRRRSSSRPRFLGPLLSSALES